jgi:hypothetical protein
MSRIYGVICDRCNKPIKVPGDHYRVIISNAVYAQTYDKDLCTQCTMELEHVIEEPKTSGK